MMQCCSAVSNEQCTVVTVHWLIIMLGLVLLHHIICVVVLKPEEKQNRLLFLKLNWCSSESHIQMIQEVMGVDVGRGLLRVPLCVYIELYFSPQHI